MSTPSYRPTVIHLKVRVNRDWHDVASVSEGAVTAGSLAAKHVDRLRRAARRPRSVRCSTRATAWVVMQPYHKLYPSQAATVGLVPRSVEWLVQVITEWWDGGGWLDSGRERR